jgi:hypothetical protein
MKIFIQVPCLNEEHTLPAVLQSIPIQIDGVDQIHVLVIDDGCSDRTVDVARASGVQHFVHHVRTMGLARSFRDGVDYALAHGADIVVNTDGDNQYPQDRVGDLVRPIIAGEADMVIADRQTQTIDHFSAPKKLMQRFGSHVVNVAAGTELPDAFSGFRAFSRSSLLRLNVLTQFSYCTETIIQAGNQALRIASVPVVTNAPTRESRLFKNPRQHMLKSTSAIIRSYVMFKPVAGFGALAVVFSLLATIPFMRFLILWLEGGPAGGHVQSLLFGATMSVAALLCVALIIVCDLLRTNRILLEEQLERIKEIQYTRPAYWDQAEQPWLSGQAPVTGGLTRPLADGPGEPEDVTAAA